MKIGIIAAMSSEYNQIACLLEHQEEETKGAFTFLKGTLGANQVVLMQCGIGKVNAASGTMEMLHAYQPNCIISTGVAGGIDASLHVMDVVVSRQIVYHDVYCGEGNEYGQVQGLPARFTSNDALYNHALSLNLDTHLVGGLICSGDKFITSKPELAAIKSQFPEGMAVDMESGAIAQVCHLYHIPFISFRIISDTPGVEEHWDQYTNFWGEMANRSFAVTHAFFTTLPESL